MNENKIIKEQQILLKQYEELHLINRGYGSSSISLFEIARKPPRNSADSERSSVREDRSA